MGRGVSKVGGGGGGAKTFTSAPFDESKDNWNDFEKSFGAAISKEDEKTLDGYVGTGKSFSLNKKLYDPSAGPLSESQQKTVDALDKVISTHKTPKDGVFTRYVDDGAIKNTLKLSNEQMGLLKSIKSMDKSEIAMLNQALKGTMSESPSFSSTSAVSKHLFKGRPFKREISVPKGTNAFATNSFEHEVIFGRNMKTILNSVSWDGQHIVLHESFVKYG